MANHTITVPDDVLKRARVRAAEQETSVNAVLREELLRFAGESDSKSAVDELLDFLAQPIGSSGEGGYTWSRDEIYEERMNRIKAGDGGG